MADDPAGLSRLAQGAWVSTLARDVFLELPEGEPPPPLGSRFAARGYAGRSPGYANRQPVPPGPWRLRVKSRQLLEVEGRSRLPRPGRDGRARRGRGGLRASGESARPAAAAGESRPGPALVRALVLGDSSGLPPSWLRGLRRTGLSHLLAVSGLHVGLVAAIALLAAFRLRPPRPRPRRPRRGPPLPPHRRPAAGPDPCHADGLRRRNGLPRRPPTQRRQRPRPRRPPS